MKLIRNSAASFALCLAALASFTLYLPAQTVEKVADLTYQLDENDVYQGGYSPVQRFTQVGTDLWFTTQSGGTNGQGTISRFDLNTHQVVQVASLGTTTGYTPASEILVIGSEGYFTTVAGGTGGNGTVAKIDLATGAVTPLFSLPLPPAYGINPMGRLAHIGEDLWVLDPLGGGGNLGVAFKYNLPSGVATVVTNFGSTGPGAEPFGGLVPVGADWYFTTLVGGSTWGTINYPVITLPDGSQVTITNRLQTGAGTLGKLSFDSQGNPVVTTVYSLPGGYEQSPSAAPILVGTNSLYFTSAGILYPNVAPGAILRYDISTGAFTNLFIFSTNPIPSTLYGIRPGYASPTEWQGDLYIVNRNGGAKAANLNVGGGTVIKFNIASNTVTKLADLSNATSPTALGSPGGSFFGSGLVVQETNRFFIYQPLPAGGAYGRGTMIRIALPPQPIQLGITNAGNGAATLTWTGGYPPFDVLTNADFNTPSTNWAPAVSGINAVANTTNWSVTLPISNENLFYRVRGQAW
jgi:uncharacterized repeat protein (TIGR03803 family)